MLRNITQSTPIEIKLVALIYFTEYFRLHQQRICAIRYEPGSVRNYFVHTCVVIVFHCLGACLLIFVFKSRKIELPSAKTNRKLHIIYHANMSKMSGTFRNGHTSCQPFSHDQTSTLVTGISSFCVTCMKCQVYHNLSRFIQCGWR